METLLMLTAFTLAVDRLNIRRAIVVSINLQHTVYHMEYLRAVLCKGWDNESNLKEKK